MHNRFLSFILFLSIVVSIFSCVNTRKTTYFYNAEDTTILSRAEDTASPMIQKSDIVSVIITSLNTEASAIFNLNSNASSSVVTNAGNSASGSGYLVNSDGNIQLPILGNIKVDGQTTKQVKQHVTDILLAKKLLIDPIVTVHHLNYEVTVLGEVGKPTVINVPSEKISLLKALGLAGDITVFGKKNNVLLIREINGKRIVKRIDMISPAFLSSPYYYLQPNDVVYVETNKNKVANSSAFRQTLPILLSSITFILIALDNIFK